MAVFVVAAGAWSSGSAWRKMRPLLRAAGHEIFTPTYTGLGEREHLATRDVNLSLHVQDLVHVLDFEDLSGVTLVGHSFGGLVATAVADRVPHRIARLIYVDAFIPQDGESLFDLVSAAAQVRMKEVCANGDGWRVPPLDMSPDTPAEDRAWAEPHRRPHPIAAFLEPVRLSGGPLPPRGYIYCRRTGPEDRFGAFAARARAEQWCYAEIDASHSPHITAPQELCALFGAFVRDSGGR